MDDITKLCEEDIVEDVIEAIPGPAFVISRETYEKIKKVPHHSENQDTLKKLKKHIKNTSETAFIFEKERTL